MLPPPAPPTVRDRLVRLRLMLVALSVCLWGVVMIVRLVQLQVLGRESFQRQAARQSERTINLDPRRGPILDRNGRPLAVSVDAESIYAVPQEIHEPDKTAATLARALGLDAAARRELVAQLQRNRAFVWVRRKLDPRVTREVRDLQLDGIGFLTETRRYYPKRELAAQVLGYVGLDNTGMSGIEYTFENAIRGRAHKVVIRTDARRRALDHTEKPSTEGHTVVLTIDESIQHVVEKELERSVQETGSVAGVAVVMDPRTGEILALANRPTFNPNKFGAYPSSRWRNRAVADAYEPGSMFKIITWKWRGSASTITRSSTSSPSATSWPSPATWGWPASPSAWAATTSTATCAISASAPPPASSCPASRAGSCGRSIAGAR
jgi:stage V sporulation protein D (sporulation-specific penicillin-binding protein)